MPPIAEAFVRLRPDLTTFRPEAERGVAGAGLGKLGDQQGKTFGTQFGEAAGKNAGDSLSTRLGAQLKRLGPGLLAGAGLLGVKAVFDKVIGGASDMNETISKSNVVFGQLSGKVQAAFADAPHSMGQTSQAANEVAATFGNLIVSMGLSQEKAAEMSVKMTKLGGDLASFNNVPVADALEAIRSGLVGETEPLRRFGVNLSDAALRAEAVRLGLGEIGTTLTAQQRTQASYSLILQQTTTAQGDFARTSTGAANQQRVLTAQLEQTASSLGSHILPAYTGLLNVVNEIGPGTVIAAAGVAVLSNRIAASSTASSAFGDLRAAFQLYSEAVTNGTPRVTAALETTKAAAVGLRGVGSSIVGLFGGPWGLALTGATIGLGFFANQMSESKARTDQLTDALKNLLIQYDRQHSLNDTAVKDLLKQNESLARLVLDTDKYGVSIDTMLAAANGVPGTLDQIRQAADDLRIKQGGLTAQQAESFNALVKLAEQGQRNALIDQTLAEAHEKERRGLQQLSVGMQEMVANYAPLLDVANTYNDRTKTSKEVADAYSNSLKNLALSTAPASDVLFQYALTADSAARAQLNASQRAQVYSDVLDGLSATADGSSTRVGVLTRVFDDIANAEISADAKARLLRQTWEQMFQPAINLTDATESFNLSLLTLGGSLEKGSRSLDINNAAGIRNRDTLQSLIQRNNDLYFANIAAGVSAEVAGHQHDINAAAIERAGVKAGLRRKDIQALNEEYGKIPAAKNTNITTTGFEAAFRKLIQAKAMQIALEQGLSLDQARAIANIQTAAHFPSVPQLAVGGKVTGPGTGTSDSVPAWLSAGEHVWTAAEVRKAGGHGAVEAMRQQIMGFAAGGWPFRVDMSRTKIPVPKAPAITPAGGALGAWIAQAIRFTGVPPTWAGPLKVLIMRESGGNPRSINRWDINAMHGDPSRGLMQTIGATFAHYHDPRLVYDIFDPIANIVAGIRYILARYGTIFRVQQANPNLPPRGYLGGGMVPGPVGRPQPAIVHGGERVLSRREMAQGLRLDEYTIGRLAQALSSRPVQVGIAGPDWDLSVAGVAP